MPPMGEASTLSARPRAATGVQTGAQGKREAQAKAPAPVHLSPAAEVAIRLLPGNDVRVVCCLRTARLTD